MTPSCPASVELDQHDDHASIIGGGDWILAHAAILDQQLSKIPAMLGQPDIQLDLRNLSRIDTAGAWLVARTISAVERSGTKVELIGSTRVRTLVDLARQASNQEIHCNAPMPDLLAKIGRASFQIRDEAWMLLVFLGEVCIKLAQGLMRPWRIRWRSVATHIERTGVDAVPIVALLSALIGLVLAYQGGLELKRFGAELFTIDLLGISVLREMGPLVAAIIVAGRTGSAFAAQIGTMKLNEELDALKTLGLDPIDMLVIPRLIGLMIALPLVTTLADIAAIIGGGLVVTLSFGIPVSQLLSQLQATAPVELLLAGLGKAPVFALIIAIVGCRNGMQVSGGAASVGERTTKAVVGSIFLVIVANAIFSIIFAGFGL